MVLLAPNSRRRAMLLKRRQAAGRRAHLAKAATGFATPTNRAQNPAQNPANTPAQNPAIEPAEGPAEEPVPKPEAKLVATMALMYQPVRLGVHQAASLLRCLQATARVLSGRRCVSAEVDFRHVHGEGACLWPSLGLGPRGAAHNKGITPSSIHFYHGHGQAEDRHCRDEPELSVNFAMGRAPEARFPTQFRVDVFSARFRLDF